VKRVTFDQGKFAFSHFSLTDWLSALAHTPAFYRSRIRLRSWSFSHVPALPLPVVSLILNAAQGRNRKRNLLVSYRLSVCASALTPWSTVLPEKLTVPQLVKKFSSFYWTRRFITAFTRLSTRSYTEPNQSSPSLHPTYWRSVLILPSYFHLGLPNWLFTSGFPAKTMYAHLLICICYMLCLSHSSCFDHPNSIWWVQIMKLLVM